MHDIKKKNMITAFVVLAIVQIIFIFSGFLNISFPFNFGISNKVWDITEISVAFGISLFLFALSFYQDTLKRQLLTFAAFMLFIVFLSYFSFSSSLLINKFIFVTNIVKLKLNYDLFCDGSVMDFLKNTLPLHQGDSESAGASFFYLIPLFISVIKLGGLSLFNLAVFNTVCSLFTILIYYFFIRKNYSKNVAVISSVIWSSGHFFQNFIRSSSYMGITLLICVLLLILFHAAIENKINIVFCSLFMSLGFHFYGPVRYLFFLPLLFCWDKKQRKKVFYFYLYFFVFTLPFVLFRIKTGGTFLDEEHIFVYAKGYEYGENIFTYISKRGTLFNIGDFIAGMLEQLSHNFRFIPTLFNTQNLRVNPHHSSLLSLFLVPFLLIGFVKSLINYRKTKYNIVIVFFICLVCLPFFITADPIQTRRIVLWPVSLFLFIGIGFDAVVTYYKGTIFRNILWILCVTVLTLHVVREIKTIAYFMPKRIPELEFVTWKRILSDQYAYRKDLYSLIDDYLRNKSHADKIDRMIFEMTSPDEDLEKDAVAVVERNYPDIILPDTNDEFFKEGFYSLWGVKGDAFRFQPVSSETLKDADDRAKIKDRFIINTFYSGKDNIDSIVGDKPIGTLTSPLFIVDKQYLSFVLKGGPTVNERVELVVGGQAVLWANSNFDSSVKTIKWDLSPYKGREARICIVDYSSQPGGYIVVGDFAFND